MRIYEELFIVKPDAPEQEIDALIEQLKQVITSAGGSLDKIEKWGVRKLAYRVAKREEGYYVLLQFSSTPPVVKEIERRLRVSDLALKFLTVRVDQRLKRLEKRKKLRAKRAARRPAPAVAPGAAAAETPATPVPGEPVAVQE